MTTLDMQNTGRPCGGRFQMAWPTRPNGERIRLNHQDFVAIDRDRDAEIRRDLSPAGSLQSRDRRPAGQQRRVPVSGSFDKSADLPAGYRPDRFPSPPSARRLPARSGYVGHVHLRLRWQSLLRGSRRGDAAERDRASPALLHMVGSADGRKSQDAARRWVPDPISMGYSGKFLEAFITERRTSRIRRSWDRITSTKKRRHDLLGVTLCTTVRRMHAFGFRIRWLWMHCIGHWRLDRPIGASSRPRPSMWARYRNRGSERSSGNRSHHRDRPERPVTAAERLVGNSEYIRSRERRGRCFYRVIRGTAEFKDSAGKVLELVTGDTVTAARTRSNLSGLATIHKFFGSVC